MNAKYIAVLLSLLVTTLPVHAQAVSQKETQEHQSLVTNSQINLNKADLSTLTGSFKGIGKKRAEAIIAYRDSHNGFKSLEELAEVKGFGQHFIDANREKLKEVFVIN